MSIPFRQDRSPVEKPGRTSRTCWAFMPSKRQAGWPSYMDASRFGKSRFAVMDEPKRLHSYIRPLMQAWCLLALMECADPRLVSLKDFASRKAIRFSGSRSDRFAITS